jgi:hypothetical protein
MSVIRPGLALTIVMTTAVSVPSARAQNTINEGRSPAQIFGAVCANCHASPRGLGRQVGAAQLPNYLRQHYTTSREQAAALAGYVASFAGQPAAAQAPPPGRRPAAEEGRAAPQPTSPAPRRRTPADEPRLEEHTAVPAPGSAPSSARPRGPETRPARARTPAEAAAQHRPPVPPAPPTSPPAESGEPHAANGPTSAIPGSEPQGPPPPRTDDIAD